MWAPPKHCSWETRQWPFSGWQLNIDLITLGSGLAISFKIFHLKCWLLNIYIQSSFISSKFQNKRIYTLWKKGGIIRSQVRLHLSMKKSQPRDVFICHQSFKIYARSSFVFSFSSQQNCAFERNSRLRQMLPCFDKPFRLLWIETCCQKDMLKCANTLQQ